MASLNGAPYLDTRAMHAISDLVRPRLVTIPLSHYCERARWALDHAGIDYDESQHVQMASWVAAKRAGGQRTVPVFVCKDGVLSDSADIVRWAAAQADVPLYPENNVRTAIEAFEAEIAEGFGVHSRLYAYSWFFRTLDECMPYNVGAAPWFEYAGLQLFRPVLARVARRQLQLSPARVREAKTAIRHTMDTVAQRLKDGRPYLFGDTFTAADLTFAALGSLCVAPPQYGVPFPDPNNVPDEEGRAFMLAMREHPAGAFILRLYRSRPRVRARFARKLRVYRA